MPLPPDLASCLAILGAIFALQAALHVVALFAIARWVRRLTLRPHRIEVQQTFSAPTPAGPGEISQFDPHRDPWRDAATHL